ncbi:MAG: hypothetical protein LBS56_07415 [Propionibacteriaceae bacterium]|nr:hypothetical protein [Propionibacteriaceae bacterium]
MNSDRASAKQVWTLEAPWKFFTSLIPSVSATHGATRRAAAVPDRIADTTIERLAGAISGQIAAFTRALW